MGDNEGNSDRLGRELVVRDSSDGLVDNGGVEANSGCAAVEIGLVVDSATDLEVDSATDLEVDSAIDLVDDLDFDPNSTFLTFHLKNSLQKIVLR